jgi:hypothetical protein
MLHVQVVSQGRKVYPRGGVAATPHRSCDGVELELHARRSFFHSSRLNRKPISEARSDRIGLDGWR